MAEERLYADRRAEELGGVFEEGVVTYGEKISVPVNQIRRIHIQVHNPVRGYGQSEQRESGTGHCGCHSNALSADIAVTHQITMGEHTHAHYIRVRLGEISHQPDKQRTQNGQKYGNRPFHKRLCLSTVKVFLQTAFIHANLHVAIDFEKHCLLLHLGDTAIDASGSDYLVSLLKF